MPQPQHHGTIHFSGSHKMRAIIQLFRGDLRHLPRVVVFSILSISIYNIGWGFADPFFSLYLSGFSEQYSVIGIFRSLMVLIGILILIPLGDLLDRVSHITLMNGAKIVYFFIGLFYFIAGQTGSVPILVIALLLNGAMAPFVWVSTMATLRDYSTKKDAALVSGFYITAYQLAGAIGLTAALWLVWQYPIHYIFIPVMIFPLLSMFLTRGLQSTHNEPLLQGLRNVVVHDKLVMRWWNDVRHFSGELRWVYVLLLITTIIPVIALTFLPLFAQSLGFSIVEIGVLLLAMSIPFFLSFIFAEFSDRFGRLRNVIIGLAVSAIAALCMVLFDEHGWQLYAFAILFITGYAILVPSLSGLVTVLAQKKNTGAASATTDLVISIGAMLFAPIAGEMIDWLGWDGLFVVAAIALLFIMILVVLLQTVFKKKNIVYHSVHKGKNEPYSI